MGKITLTWDGWGKLPGGVETYLRSCRMYGKYGFSYVRKMSKILEWNALYKYDGQ